jgi:EmrB/QacA subfamily drug resistance transporter
MRDGQSRTASKWLVMLAVSIGLFMSAVDSSIANIALPTLQRVFRTPFAAVQWVVLAYALTVVTLMLSVGRLGDIYGRKPFYVSGFAGFTIGSFLCASSQSVAMLIASRVLQGCGAVMLLALGSAIVIEAFPREERGKALGISGLMISLGLVSGPTLGGLLINHIGWQSIFLINVPIGILGTLLAWRFVPVDKPASGQQFDLAGAFCMLCALLALLLGLTLGQSAGFASLKVLILFAAAVAGLVAFIFIELNKAQPMIDLRLFANRQLSVGLIGTLLTYLAIAGVLVLLPFYLQNVLGMNPGQAGIYLAILPLAMAVSSPLSGWLSDRVGTPPIAVAGLALMLLGFLLVRQLGESSTLLHYALIVTPIGLGMGVFQSPNNSEVMGSAVRERLGIMSGLLAVIRNLGQTVGVALLGTLWIIRSAARQGSAYTPTSETPIHIQVLALHDVVLVVAAVIAATLAITVWAWLVQDK